MKKIALPMISLAVLGAAAWILYGELSKYPPHQIVAEIKALPRWRLGIAAGVTLACYWIMTFYDWLAFKFVRCAISYAKVTFGAFLAFAFGNNVGLANFAGTAVRLRVYSQWRIETKTIAEVVALDTLANWIGFLLAPGLVFAIHPPAVPGHLPLPFTSARPIGFLFLALVAAYTVFALLKRRPIKIWKWQVPVPNNRFFFLQVLVACCDLTLGSLVLHVLLPAGSAITFWSFLGIFLLAQTIGLLSHVPGALGVFETVMLVSLSPLIAGPRVFGALVAYRAIYYFFPLALAVPLFLGFEWRHAARPAPSDRMVP